MCGADEITLIPCGGPDGTNATQDTVCGRCKACEPGHYHLTVCGDGNATPDCAWCATCGAGQFSSTRCRDEEKRPADNSRPLTI